MTWGAQRGRRVVVTCTGGVAGFEGGSEPGGEGMQAAVEDGSVGGRGGGGDAGVGSLRQASGSRWASGRTAGE